MSGKVFKRYELKFMVNKETFDILTKEIEEYMILDKNCSANGSYIIYNIYFDTENDDIIRKSIEKPYYKEKLRLRCYKGHVTDEDIVFLELKKKIGGIVSKRRTTMTYLEAKLFVEKGVFPSNISYTDNQVLLEICEFLSRYPSKPKVYISYERIAYYAKENREIRVTFDKNILSRRNNINFTDGDFGMEILDEDKYLMEVKILGAIPMWLVEQLSSLGLYKKSFSKYGEEYKNYTKRENNILKERKSYKVVNKTPEKCFLSA